MKIIDNKVSTNMSIIKYSVTSNYSTLNSHSLIFPSTLQRLSK